jgi:hypothetical protein
MYYADCIVFSNVKHKLEIRNHIQLFVVEEITRHRKRYKKIYLHTRTDRRGCYLAVDIYPKDLFNTEMCITK